MSFSLDATKSSVNLFYKVDFLIIKSNNEEKSKDDWFS